MLRQIWLCSSDPLISCFLFHHSTFALRRSSFACLGITVIWRSQAFFFLLNIQCWNFDVPDIWFPWHPSPDYLLSWCTAFLMILYSTFDIRYSAFCSPSSALCHLTSDSLKLHLGNLISSTPAFWLSELLIIWYPEATTSLLSWLPAFWPINSPNCQPLKQQKETKTRNRVVVVENRQK